MGGNFNMGKNHEPNRPIFEVNNQNTGDDNALINQFSPNGSRTGTEGGIDAADSDEEEDYGGEDEPSDKQMMPNDITMSNSSKSRSFIMTID